MVSVTPVCKTRWEGDGDSVSAARSFSGSHAMHLLHLAAAAVPLLLAASLASPGGASATEHHVTQPEGVSGPVTPRSSLAINTGSRSEVRVAYRQMWRSADGERPEWIGGSVRTCEPGTLSGDSTDQQLGALNFARLLSGLTPLALDKDSIPRAQAAAIMMTAGNAVNHYPPTSWPCWSQTGYDAAGMSNLYQGVRSESNADKVESYLDDWGSINHEVGHRRWFLHPYLAAIGLGGTATANVSYLFGRPFDDSAPNPAWVRWPAAGWFPNRLDPRGRWSLSSGDDGADFSRARVRVTFDDEPVRGIVLRTPEASPGKPTLVWEMPDSWPADPVGRATVTVSDITIDGIEGRSTSYAVKFFRSR